MSIRIIPCETCCGEGRMYKSRYGGNDPDVWDAGPCPECDGACVIEEQVEPRTLDDLEQEDIDEGVSPAIDDGRCPCGFDEPKCTAYRDQCLYAGETQLERVR